MVDFLDFPEEPRRLCHMLERPGVLTKKEGSLDLILRLIFHLKDRHEDQIGKHACHEDHRPVFQ